MRRTILLLSLVLVGQVYLSAQSELDVSDEKLEKSTAKSKKVGLGIEGGWGGNLSFSDINSFGRSTGRLGLTIMAGDMVDGIIAKRTYDTSIGYIFIKPIKGASNAWGFYVHSTFHTNFPINKNKNGYFYTGYGFGFDYMLDDKGNDIMDFQLARIPLGLKFLAKGFIELFIEASVSIGVDSVFYVHLDNMDDVSATGFSLGSEFKGGLRFWL